MLDHQIIQRVADAAAGKIRGGMEFTTAVRTALRGNDIPKNDWGEYFTAIATELSDRARIKYAEGLPKVPQPSPKKDTPQPPAEPQLGFGFGEGNKIRPPRRRAA